MEEQKSNHKKKPGLPELSKFDLLDLILEPKEPNPEGSIVPEAKNTGEDKAPAGSGSRTIPAISQGRSKSSVQSSYESLFLQGRNISGSQGKVVYIHPDFHRRITRIIQIVGEDKISLFTYLHHILEHHFKLFEKEITADYNRKNNEPIL
ncbi:hypothetical protein M2347_003921 [Chryseobacterium sp. H1D6B]|uniref:DUF3408 domain-containing protein n=1 Tax=Chryseobacterium sp. H1D6B TaxID=2940588 RepID=UPI0015C76FE2|nr:DUF3408 domain-containing protein [Chryseobacterium sp. H1D6B]MDH6254194.1 hypothetical protein [Chryseobacterium sp. H1D6B]